MSHRRRTKAITAANRRDQSHINVAADASLVRRPRRYARWRAATLIGVYVLMAIHIAHWKIAGKTLAPLELNEVMYTLEHGVLTAGFVFMALAVLSVMIFGRFFCSWGCHILALQDLCEWLLRKIGIRPKPVRSRALLLVPVGAMAYMFLWPQVPRIIHAVWPNPPLNIAAPPQWKLRILTDLDHENWASFVTNDFWRNLPGPWVSAMTFLVVGFAMVYLLGSRSFCTYGCPYGAVFALADRIAPGKIMSSSGNGQAVDCSACGLCTAACQSHIRVHEELTVFGRVVSPACLKDLDCVAVCPNEKVRYGFTTPGGFKSWRPRGRFGVPYDFSLREDLLMTSVFLCTMLIFRGLYDAVPLLMCIGLGAIMAYGALLFVRLWSRRDLRLNNFQLRIRGRITSAGYAFAAIAIAAISLSAHSGVIRYREAAGRSAADAVLHSAAQGLQHDPGALGLAISHLQFCERWGLVHSPSADQQLASLLMLTDQPHLAEPYIRRLLADQPGSAKLRLTLAAVLLVQERAHEAIAHLMVVVTPEGSTIDNSPNAKHTRALAHEMLAEIRAVEGRLDLAMDHYRKALEINPASMRSKAALAELEQ